MAKGKKSIADAILALSSTIEEAAEEAKISAEEVRQRITFKREEDADYEEDRMMFLAHDALTSGFEALKDALKDKKRLKAEGFGEGRYNTYALADIDAAKMLIKLGMDTRKMIEAKRAHESTRKLTFAEQMAQRPFFAKDGAKILNYPWDFLDAETQLPEAIEPDEGSLE